MDVPARKAMLGRVVDTESPGIIKCKSIHEPMQTCLNAVDSLILIDHG
ncbi:unnamed protein product [Coffea canephora]|uniref:Uncharacterized protein n=1 Tax=Coffea canephora TaxID=49390 RepID=A0A068V944_COFCA|nr:unnamed protein product [Coffea canephora]